MPISNINFIPESLAQERKAKQNQIIGTQFSIILVTLFIIGSLAIWLYNWNTDKKIQSTQSEIDQKKSEIDSMRNIGEAGYKLGARLSSAQEIINSRVHISVLMEKIRSNTPQKIEISSWTYSPGQNLVLQGVSAGGYVAIDDLRQEFLKATGKDQKPIFKDVVLDSASFEKEKGNVTFKVTGIVNSESLYGSN